MSRRDDPSAPPAPASSSAGGARALAVPGGRLARLARFGGLAGGIGARMAAGGVADLASGRRRGLRELLLTPANMRRVADDLARMRGAAMKVGQLISMDAGEVMPPELADLFARLRAEADFMPPRQLSDALDARWGRGWRSRFRRFDPRPMAAASIGQVHYAEAKDGRRLAIKVQYPGVKRAIRSDVDNVAALVRMSGLVPAGLDLAPLMEDAKRQLEAEADYAREAAALAEWADRLEGTPGFAVPRPHADLSTPEVLAMDWMQGRPVETLAEPGADPAARARAVRRLIDLTLRELFEFGAMQTDPNFANYLWDDGAEDGAADDGDGRLVLLDFGAAQPLPAETTEGYRTLLTAGLAGDRAGMAAGAEALGLIAPEDAPHHRRAVEDMVARSMVALAEDWPLARVRAELVPEMREAGLALAEDGGFGSVAPMATLLVQRKLAGVFLLAARLEVDVPARAMLEARLGRTPAGPATDAGA